MLGLVVIDSMWYGWSTIVVVAGAGGCRGCRWHEGSSWSTLVGEKVEHADVITHTRNFAGLIDLRSSTSHTHPFTHHIDRKTLTIRHCHFSPFTW